MNNTCIECDYLMGCRKKLKIGEDTVFAKKQDVIPLCCICTAQELCRTCSLFWDMKCVTWQVVNGKKVMQGVLHSCPKWRRIKY